MISRIATQIDSQQFSVSYFMPGCFYSPKRNYINYLTNINLLAKL